MKDYTKYDFAAIVGAEVEIHYHAGEPLIVKLINFNNKAKILACVVLAKNAYDMPVGRIDYTHVSEIASITAKITPRRMTLEQLHFYYKSLAKRDGYEDYVVIIRGGEVEEPSNRITYSLKRMDAEDIEEFGPWTKDVDEPLDDYIDCTDWGWKHE